MDKKLDNITIFLLVLCFIVFVFLGAKFDTRDEYDMERDAKAEKLVERFNEGICYAQGKIVNHLESELMDLSFEIEDIYGISPEEALQIMEHYLDNEPVSEESLANAIWAIRAYYYKSLDIPNEVEKYWID